MMAPGTASKAKLVEILLLGFAAALVCAILAHLSDERRYAASASASDHRRAEVDATLVDIREKCERQELDLATRDAELADLRIRVCDAESAAGTAELARATTEREHETLKRGITAAEVRLQQAAEQLALAQSRLVTVRGDEGALRWELLGLKNRPRRVVFCVDSSGSMAKQSPGLPGSRWDDALRVIRTWITVLPIDEAALVTFNTAAHAFPKHRRLLNLSGPERAANIKLILKRLQETKPQGSTNLIDAVRCAFSFSEAEAVVLFSDGKPTKRAGFDPALANEILAEARQQKPRRKFVVVAVADYFDREASSFLVRLALENDGAFLGR